MIESIAARTEQIPDPERKPADHRENATDDERLLLEGSRFVFDAGGVGFAERLAGDDLGFCRVLHSLQLLEVLLRAAREFGFLLPPVVGDVLFRLGHPESLAALRVRAERVLPGLGHRLRPLMPAEVAGHRDALLGRGRRCGRVVGLRCVVGQCGVRRGFELGGGERNWNRDLLAAFGVLARRLAAREFILESIGFLAMRAVEHNRHVEYRR